MSANIKKWWLPVPLELLNFAHRRQAVVLIMLMVIGMLFEMLSIGLVVPVIILLMQQDLSAMPAMLRGMIDWLGPLSHEQLVIGVLSLLTLAYTCKTLFLSYLAWRKSDFAYALQSEYAQRLFAVYIAQPYEFYLRRNSAQLVRNASAEITIWTSHIVMPSLQLMTECMLMIGLFTLMLMLQPIAILTVGSLLGILVTGFYHLVRVRVTAWGRDRQFHDGMKIQLLQQTFGGIKEVKLLGCEQEFMHQFDVNMRASAQAGLKQATLQQTSPPWLEWFAVIAFVALISVLMSTGSDTSAIVPTVGLFAAAAFRMIPSANRILNSLQQLRYGQSAAELLEKELTLGEPMPFERVRSERLGFAKSIEFQNVTFSYDGSSTPALHNISLTILKSQSIGLIGPSGSGKSTLVDLMLGLLRAQSGRVSVDGLDIQQNMRSWQNLLGYVPQTIYLTDDSLRRNIALGVPADQISDEAIQSALRAAQLEDWVSTLPQGLDTVVGERGVRISGGQRQRIGIARALYTDPEILVLDEATSALDVQTEQEVMKAISALRGTKTLILVAHRLSTLDQCDRLFKLEHGQLVEEIVADSQMAR